MPEQQRFIRGMISWIGGRQVEIPYVREPRFSGTTKYPLGKMVKFAVDAVTSFSISPLRLATWLSFGGGIFSLLVMLHACLLWLTGQTVPGWTSIMAAIGVFGSLQLLVLGVIGEYVGRLFIEQKRRPLFLIDRVVTSRDRNSTATEDGVAVLRNYPRQAIEQAVEHVRSPG
jgi:dolichol-phosphate mannosyltransferase